jgi:hypothetical protein
LFRLWIIISSPWRAAFQATSGAGTPDLGLLAALPSCLVILRPVPASTATRPVNGYHATLPHKLVLSLLRRSTPHFFEYILVFPSPAIHVSDKWCKGLGTFTGFGVSSRFRWRALPVAKTSSSNLLCHGQRNGKGHRSL